MYDELEVDVIKTGMKGGDTETGLLRPVYELTDSDSETGTEGDDSESGMEDGDTETVLQVLLRRGMAG